MLDELRDLARQRTPGVWAAAWDGGWVDTDAGREYAGLHTVTVSGDTDQTIAMTGDDEQSKVDADFIVAVANKVDAFLALVEIAASIDQSLTRGHTLTLGQRGKMHAALSKVQG